MICACSAPTTSGRFAANDCAATAEKTQAKKIPLSFMAQFYHKTLPSNWDLSIYFFLAIRRIIKSRGERLPISWFALWPVERVSSWSLELESGIVTILFKAFNAEALRRRVRRVLFSRVEHVDRVEIFMQASPPQSLIIYSRYSTEGSDTFGLNLLQTFPLARLSLHLILSITPNYNSSSYNSHS